MCPAASAPEPDSTLNPPVIRQAADRTLVVCGRVDSSSVLPLRLEGERLITACEPEQSLNIDLSGLATASSIVLSLLLCWQRKATASRVDLHYSGVGERLRALASLSNLDKHLSGF